MEQELTESYVKELLTTGDSTEGQLLVPRKIYDILIDEVDKALIPRTEAAFYIGPAGIPGSSVDIDLVTPNKMSVRIVAEGSEIYLDQEEYSTTNVKPVKYGVAIKITKELMEDSKWDMLAHNVKRAGKLFAENETNLILTALDGAANTVSGGTAVTIANITRATQYLDDADYNATTLLVGNEVINDCRNIDTFVEAQKFGSNEMLRNGMVGTLYGLNVIKFSTNAAPSTTYAKYAYVYDKMEAFCIAEKRPITVENFTIPLMDMQGAAITQRIKVTLLRSSAVAKITSS